MKAISPPSQIPRSNACWNLPELINNNGKTNSENTLTNQGLDQEEQPHIDTKGSHTPPIVNPDALALSQKSDQDSDGIDEMVSESILHDKYFLPT